MSKERDGVILSKKEIKRKFDASETYVNDLARVGRPEGSLTQAPLKTGSRVLPPWRARRRASAKWRRMAQHEILLTLTSKGIDAMHMHGAVVIIVRVRGHLSFLESILAPFDTDLRCLDVSNDLLVSISNVSTGLLGTGVETTEDLLEPSWTPTLSSDFRDFPDPIGA